jgi:transforming growth factor-beta-induced protein
MKRLPIVTLFVLLIASLVLSACAPAATSVPTMQPAPTQPPAPTQTPMAPMETSKPKDIVDTAVADGRFKTLVAAVQAAGLVDTLKGKGPFTVFAPTDDAFAKLPAGTVDALLKDLPKLKDTLLYHVVPGKVMAADVLKLDGKMVDTALMDQQVKITVKDGKVYLNDNVQVIITDVETSNGVIHVIDTVLLPK